MIELDRDDDKKQSSQDQPVSETFDGEMFYVLFSRRQVGSDVVMSSEIDYITLELLNSGGTLLSTHYTGEVRSGIYSKVAHKRVTYEDIQGLPEQHKDGPKSCEATSRLLANPGEVPVKAPCTNELDKLRLKYAPTQSLAAFLTSITRIVLRKPMYKFWFSEDDIKKYEDLSQSC